MPIDAPGSTAVVVLAPEAEPVVGDLYRAHSSAGADGMTPHLTLLVPFVPTHRLDAGVQARLARLFQRFRPFDYVLERLEWFAEGVLYLAPQPPQAFIVLVEALVEEFPDYPPYAGVHKEIVPHVTVAESQDREQLEGIRSDIESELPITCRAEAATLVERGADLKWRPRASFPLGSLE